MYFTVGTSKDSSTVVQGVSSSHRGGCSSEEDVFSWLDDVWLVDGVFDGAFGGVRDEEVVVGEGVGRLSSSFVRSKNSCFEGVGDEKVVLGEGVVVTSSSLEMLTNSCLGGIMVSLIFLEGLEEEA
nr:hypothetical protein [Tanacetum cinerariifolium]